MKKIVDFTNSANVFVVLGQVGSGKTHLVLGHEGTKLVVSFDGSYSTLAGHKSEITVVEPDISDYNDAEKFVSEIDSLAKGCDLVVLDNILAAENSMVDAITDGKFTNNFFSSHTKKIMVLLPGVL